MTRYSLFDSPLLLGFDELGEMVERLSKSAGSGYPPYNIEQTSENGLRISLAVAGFSMDELQVSVEDRQLVIRGRQDDGQDDGRVFLHRGIASRAFQRMFLLSDEIEIEGAHLDKGLLHIDMVRILPEKTVQTIAIKSGKDGNKSQKATTKALPKPTKSDSVD